MKINQKAFTLLEIIFASLIFGVIVLGVVTSNIALQKNSKNSADTYYTIQNTSVSLNRILRDALLITGTPSSPGFAGSNSDGTSIGIDFLGNPINATNTGDPNTFCFYSNQSGAPSSMDPGGNWTCYTLITTDNTIHKCSIANGSPFAKCSSSDELIGNAKKIAFTFHLNNPSNDTQKSIFSIIIENCPDPSNVNCKPGTNYPYIIKSGSVTPSAQSAG